MKAILGENLKRQMIYHLPFYLSFREATSLAKSLVVALGNYQLPQLYACVHNEGQDPLVCPLQLILDAMELHVPRESLHILCDLLNTNP